ncbi:5'-nucleotidase, lipoprotein e(P4) family [Wocania ichthyoenteri]|uniref:5'-nucleotidase, lipoprotein e(P4) family n=1 Tax=Wocania ichthyoenteri TaxID=1230531 RepID=UPI00053F0185|nr:5'-nucleotidase, lipoprotein e(P4) family [Wocania ichthyoenteri]
MIKKITYYSVVTCFILFAISCKVQSVNAEDNAPMVLQGPAWAAAWQQKAGEYKALCYQAYNLAHMQLDFLMREPSEKPYAIITDIDETVLDNSPYQVHLALQNAEYSDASWIEWTAKVDCDTIPGALSFLRYAKSKGVSVFYITNRLEEERNQTLKDLKRWGFPDTIDNHLTMKTDSSSKELRRKKVSDEYNVLLLMGDNLGDFSTVFDKKSVKERNHQVQDHAAMFGTKFIVFPNVMYGHWDGAIYDYKYDLSPNEKEKMIMQSLKKY